MISRGSISVNLRQLDRRFRRAKTTKDTLYFSKLALLELCGWIEDSMDDIVTRCAIRHLKLQANRNFCADQIVERTWGFDYHNNFRFMLIRLIGLIAVEKIEGRVDQTVRTQMMASLTTLKAERNREAHSYIKGTTRTINAPSVTVTHLAPVFRGLSELDQAIRNTKF